jgi:hypothetical protein
LKTEWVAAGLRDWRIWALTVTIQGPGVRAVFRYAPAPLVVFPLAIVASFLFYAACIHGPLTIPLRRSFRLTTVVGILGTAAINLALYPRADALKHEQRGSDEDDALITTAERLILRQRPVYVPTYLGNTPSAGPGWAMLVAPLTMTHAYALLTPVSVALLTWIVNIAGGGAAGAILALLLTLSSVAFWELSVTGSDLFPLGVLFVAVSALAWRRQSPGTSIALAALVSAAASSRAAFGWVTAQLAVIMWRAGRAGWRIVAAATAVTVALEAWFWWPDAGSTPLHLFAKFVDILGPAGTAVAVGSALASAAWAAVQARHHDARIENCWLGLWIVLAAPLAVVSVGLLAAAGWQVAEWNTAGYVEVAVPPLVALVALQTGRHAVEAA